MSTTSKILLVLVLMLVIAVAALLPNHNKHDPSAPVVKIEHEIDTLRVSYVIHDTVEKVSASKAKGYAATAKAQDSTEKALLPTDTTKALLACDSSKVDYAKAYNTLTKALAECDTSKALRDSVFRFNFLSDFAVYISFNLE